MKTKLTSLILLLSLILVFNSCCRKQKCKCKEEWGEEVDDCTPKDHGPYYLGEAKDYLYFKPGSWWVYQNDLSGEIDSIYTVYCDTLFHDRDVAPREKWQTLSYTEIGVGMRSDVYNIDYYYQQAPVRPDVKDFAYYLWMDRTYSPPTGPNGHAAPFAYPYESMKNFKEFLPSIEVHGKTYSDVIVFQVERDESIQKSDSTRGFRGTGKYFWARNYGLVKIEAHSNYYNDPGINEKWELVRYNLVH